MAKVFLKAEGRFFILAKDIVMLTFGGTCSYPVINIMGSSLMLVPLSNMHEIYLLIAVKLVMQPIAFLS